jgi:anti-sigma factor RsiW
MTNDDVHLSDQEMLLSADGELSTRSAAQVHAHLASCWSCRGRMAEIQETITAFARAYRQTLDPQLPSMSGPRALLGARLAELASNNETNWWRRFLGYIAIPRRSAFIGTAILIAVVASSFLVPRSTLHSPSSVAAAFERDLLPNRSLTPGATRRVTVTSDLCTMAHEKVVVEVSPSMRQEVFQRYGIVNAHASNYEVDYLIAPGLGGTEDIRNLWPQPYQTPVWNAYVKDALEERLHEMVCNGEVDLPTAQRDISTNWIAAYKKYFHTNKPLPLTS